MAFGAEGGRFLTPTASELHSQTLPRNYLTHVYLKVCGEVAEWLKAAVC